MTTVNAESVLVEHARGDSLRTIGRRHAISHEKARRLILEAGRTLVDEIAHVLLIAQYKDDRGEIPLWPTIEIPYGQAIDDWRDNVLLLEWVLKQLRQRGYDVEAINLRSRQGVVFQLHVPRRTDT